MRIAFVVCPSYHGATLLALLLNNHSQVSALGDMLPTRDGAQMCACGRRVRECDFWQAVSSGVDASPFVGLPTLLPVLPWPLSRHPVEWGIVPLSRNQRLNRAAGRLAGRVVDVGAPAVWRLRTEPVREFVDAYRSFYGRVLELHGTTTFVDGNKSWRKVALLARELQPADDVRIVHLVRDPRGFVASRRRHAHAEDAHAEDLRQSAWMWADLHRRMERLADVAPYRLLRYEDLCERPEAEMRALFGFLGRDHEDVVAPPRYDNKHHILGNRMLTAFAGDVALDERWRNELSEPEQRAVLAAAGPLARRLAYEERASTLVAS